LARGLNYLAKLRRLGVRVLHGVRLDEFRGGDGVEAVAYRKGDTLETIACDAVAYGFGLRPELGLAELAGAELRYDAVFRQWLPRLDEDGRAQPSLYVAGDGGAIGGADAAEASGRLAALALLADRGVALRRDDRVALRRCVARLRHFQQGLAEAFAWPQDWIGDLPDDVTVCRCEGIAAGELRRMLRADFGAAEINRLKAVTRLGMGRCQGRYCGLAGTELAAAELRVAHERVGYLRAQAPVKPLTISAKLAE
jgi:NADPH-dependent 2,4-dienoyl-CoA reductase/sulfur reductase-like enzyme